MARESGPRVRCQDSNGAGFRQPTGQTCGEVARPARGSAVGAALCRLAWPPQVRLGTAALLRRKRGSWSRARGTPAGGQERPGGGGRGGSRTQLAPTTLALCVVRRQTVRGGRQGKSPADWGGASERGWFWEGRVQQHCLADGCRPPVCPGLPGALGPRGACPLQPLRSRLEGGPARESLRGLRTAGGAAPLQRAARLDGGRTPSSHLDREVARGGAPPTLAADIGRLWDRACSVTLRLRSLEHNATSA